MNKEVFIKLASYLEGVELDWKETQTRLCRSVSITRFVLIPIITPTLFGLQSIITPPAVINTFSNTNFRNPSLSLVHQATSYDFRVTLLVTL